MENKQAYIEKYKQLHLSKTGLLITDQEALDHFTKLVTLVSAVYRPIELSVFENQQCPLCLDPIKFEDFEDPESINEFLISGMDQKCQNKNFK
ncbi:MAG: hypothetical protein UX31_C0001G0040 [Candidatus Nomurabacteria bacterium GW2011_GWA1_46_11]|uniref:Uncharacterized protein n=2 Tax=Parcubacteria group TaxID=1794811 RepID=A0A1F8EYY0_9BACT|nr:MAG: hypothetical protein UX31_C0001G0040 [Candidatus Nomurabacteria bacterium GW2011_GWA1_46_11]OGN06071.1 MAG: hypothetical protein A2669_00880 [Candidatus Yanofskybacteria bacterium RIFCSPHIGHO2_01_FULL_48_25b]